MTLARTHCLALIGVRGRVVDVEADLADGVPGISLIGLPDTALSEAKDRVRAAMVNSGVGWPQRRATVSLSPADLHKRGSHYDLALAVAIVAANGKITASSLQGHVLLGELGLDGRVREVAGVLPMVLAAAEAGMRSVIVPEGNAEEARLVPDVFVLGVRSLRQVIAFLRGEQVPDEPVREEHGPPPSVGAEGVPDLADVLGQPEARLAAEVAAAGGHHLCLIGPPGAGKTMIAERLPGLLPDLSLSDALEVTAVHSVAGTLPSGQALITRPPYRSPHHTASVAAMVGGGAGAARPGEVSRAHRGVLFLDEAPQFSPGVHNALREPLEKGVIALARSHRTVQYPARFQLVMAANPCPCGGHGTRGLLCQCSPDAVRRYGQRIPGPVRDRVDLWLAVRPVSRRALLADRGQGESSAVVAARVAEARERQRRRYAADPWSSNADVPGPQLRRRWPVPSQAVAMLDRGLQQGLLTARGATGALRVAWTLADLAGRELPVTEDVGLALVHRLGESAA